MTEAVAHLVVDEIGAVGGDVGAVGLGAEQPPTGVEHDASAVVAADLPARLQRGAQPVGRVGAREGDAQVDPRALGRLGRGDVDEAHAVLGLPAPGVGEHGGDRRGESRWRRRRGRPRSRGVQRTVRPVAGGVPSAVAGTATHRHRAAAALDDLGAPLPPTWPPCRWRAAGGGRGRDSGTRSTSSSGTDAAKPAVRPDARRPEKAPSGTSPAPARRPRPRRRRRGRRRRPRPPHGASPVHAADVVSQQVAPDPPPLRMCSTLGHLPGHGRGCDVRPAEATDLVGSRTSPYSCGDQ